MTQYLPPNLLALFAPRDPIPYMTPMDKLPHEKKLTPYRGVAACLQEFEDPKDTPPPTRVETKDERKERKRRERAEQVAYKLEQDLAMWDPINDGTITGDPYKSLFVARVNYDTSESKLRREFEAYGTVKQIRVAYNSANGKPRGYAFIEFEHERDMHSAYKHADGKKIDGRRVLVDIERGRTIKGWRPRRLGGGLGGTRKGGPDVNTKYSGREENSQINRDREDRSRSRERERERGDRGGDRGDRGDRDRERDKDTRDRRRRSRSRDKRRRSRSPRESRESRRKRSRSRDRGRRASRDRSEVVPEESEVEKERDRKRPRRSRSRDRGDRSRRSRSRDRTRRRRSRSRERGGSRRSRDRDRGMGDDSRMQQQAGYGDEGFDPNMVIKQEENGDDDAYGQYSGIIPPEEDDTFKEEFAASQQTGDYPNADQSAPSNPYGDFGGYAKNGDSDYEENVPTYSQ